MDKKYRLLKINIVISYPISKKFKPTIESYYVALPTDIITSILEYLPRCDQGRAGLVCKEWNKLGKSLNLGTAVEDDKLT